MPTLSDQRDELLQRLKDHATNDGILLAERAIQKSADLLLWLRFLEHHRNWQCAVELLQGARAATLESATYIALGLGRAAITAMRSQIELTLGFTYFGTHPEEWKRLLETGDGFMLTTAIRQYHENVSQGFTLRRALIEEAAQIKLTDIYGILSAHIHGQSPMTIPKAGEMRELISTRTFNASIVELQGKTSEAISNFLLALYADEWAALPVHIIKTAVGILSPGQQRLFFLDSFSKTKSKQA